MKKIAILFSGLVIFKICTAQNVGVNNNSPVGKMTIAAPAANHNLPTVLLIDSATNNSGGAVLQFRNSIDKRMHIQSHFGSVTNGSDSYLTFSRDGLYNMRLRGDGLLGIGTTTPAYAGLEVNKKVGKVLAAFGGNEGGVAIESNMPGIHFNNYNYDGSRKTMVGGYGGGIEFNYLTGTMGFYNSASIASAGAFVNAASNKMFINKNGNVGIGVSDPQSLLHINGNASINANNYLEFGQGLDKEINAGKIGYGLFTPQTLDIVGAGTNTTPRRIRLWSEGGTEFTGNADVFDSLRIRGLQTVTAQAKRKLFVNAAGVINADGEDAIKFVTINAAEFNAIRDTDNSSAVDKVSSPAADLLLFRNTNNSSIAGAGYFSYPLSRLPFGAKIVRVRVNYISKKPENNHSAFQLKSRICVSIYGQFIDPVFGGTSNTMPVIGPSDYTESVNEWYTPAGGLNVTGTTVNNPAGFATVNQFPNSIIVWSVLFTPTGNPVTISDFKDNSSWPINKALSFHSVEIGYKM